MPCIAFGTQCVRVLAEAVDTYHGCQAVIYDNNKTIRCVPMPDAPMHAGTTR